MLIAIYLNIFRERSEKTIAPRTSFIILCELISLHIEEKIALACGSTSTRTCGSTVIRVGSYYLCVTECFDDNARYIVVRLRLSWADGV